MQMKKEMQSEKNESIFKTDVHNGAADEQWEDVGSQRDSMSESEANSQDL